MAANYPMSARRIGSLASYCISTMLLMLGHGAAALATPAPKPPVEEAQHREIQPSPSTPESRPSTSTKHRPPVYRDISGLYSFLSSGESIQITFEGNRLTGYISRNGELPSDKGVHLDQFISDGAVDGTDIYFITRPLHGLWYEFRGKVQRGDAKDRSREGFYLLEGELTEYARSTEDKDKDKDKVVARKRQATFRLLPEVDAEQESPRGKTH